MSTKQNIFIQTSSASKVAINFRILSSFASELPKMTKTAIVGAVFRLAVAQVAGFFPSHRKHLTFAITFKCIRSNTAEVFCCFADENTYFCTRPYHYSRRRSPYPVYPFIVISYPDPTKYQCCSVDHKI